MNVWILYLQRLEEIRNEDASYVGGQHFSIVQAVGAKLGLASTGEDSMVILSTPVLESFIRDLSGLEKNYGEDIDY